MTLSTEEQLKSVAFEVFQWFSYIGNPKNPISREKMQKLFHNDVKIYTNGIQPCLGLQQFYERLVSVQSKVQHLKYSIKDVLSSDDKVIVRYQISVLDKENQPHELYVVAILQVMDGRISHWWEIIHEKGSSNCIAS